LRALVIHQPGDARVELRADPTLNDGWVLLRPILVGVCGSDLHAFTGHQPFVRYPVVPGHEMVGEIVAVAKPGASPALRGTRFAPVNLQPGLRVTIDPAVPCGECYACRIGRYNACEKQQVIGVHIAGAMADLVAVRADCISIVPDVLPDEVAVLAEPLAIGVQACERGRIRQGDDVVIVGGGMIGLAVLLQARLLGARCGVVEPSEFRAAMAAKLGAEVVATPEEALEVFNGWGTGGRPTVAVEAAGRPHALELAMDLVSAAGRVVVLGFWPETIHIPGSIIVRKELDVIGSRLHRNTIPVALSQLASGRLQPRSLISAVEPLEKGPQVFADLASGRLQAVKVLLRP
jgi:threonine dehydrogenase-like Zn-dependent dehydrogenase